MQGVHRNARLYAVLKAAVLRQIESQREGRLSEGKHSAGISTAIRTLKGLKQELSRGEPNVQRANTALTRAMKSLGPVVQDYKFWNAVDPGQTGLGAFSGHIRLHGKMRYHDDRPKVIQAIDDFLVVLQKALGQRAESAQEALPDSAPTTPEEKRDAYSDLDVTLDGKPAQIMGFRNRFGTIAQYPRGASHEWAWETIYRIAKRGGDFKS